MPTSVRRFAPPATTSITTRPAFSSRMARPSNPTAPTSTATATAGRRCPTPASPSIDTPPHQQGPSCLTRGRSVMGQVIRKVALSLALTALACPLLAAAPAQAASTRTWVSGATTADDMNPCSRTSRCKTFAGALAKTAAGGEINCLDPGDFGPVTIIFSLTISCEAGTAGIAATNGATGIRINAGATDVVTLRGLDIDGQGSGAEGIGIGRTKAVHIEKCSIRNFRGFGNAPGILTSSESSFTGFLFVEDTVFSDNDYGILLFNQSGGFKIVSLKNVAITGSTVDGLQLADGNIFANVTESIISGNGGNAVFVAPVSTVNIERSMLANNGGAALATFGIIRASGNSIYNNTVGIQIANFA